MSQDQNNDKSSKKDKATDAEQKVAKTMLDIDMLDAIGAGGLLTPQKPNEPEKTETSKSDKEADPSLPAPVEEKRVAKTLLESDIPDAVKLAVAAAEAAEAKAKEDALAREDAKAKAAPEPDPSKPIARTMIDVDALDAIGLDLRISEPVEPPTTTAQPEPEPAPEPVPPPANPDAMNWEDFAPTPTEETARIEAKSEVKTEQAKSEPQKPVARTMIDVDALDSIGLNLRLTDPEPAPVAETPASTPVPVESPSTETKREPTRTTERVVPKAAYRRVAKTIMATAEQSPFNESLTAAEEDQSVTRPASKPAIKAISKTLLDSSINDILEKLNPQPEEKNLPAVQQSAAPATNLARGDQFVAKTMLDHSILEALRAKAGLRDEAKALELAKQRAAEPQKFFVPVTPDKVALNCPWKWNEMDPNIRTLFCEQCKTQVYNFDGMEMPEAKALVFKRENNEKPTLYKRADGKFMTQDCPVEAKKQKTIMMVAIAIGFFVVMSLAIVAMMPAPPEPPPKPAITEPVSVPFPTSTSTSTSTTGTETSSTPQNSTTTGTTTGGDNFAGGTNMAGEKIKEGPFHFVAGKGVVSAPAKAPEPVTTTTTTTTPDPDENGQFWKYSK